MRTKEIYWSMAEREVLEKLHRDGCLEGAADGIMRQALTRGWDSLSERQEAELQRVLEPHMSMRCSRQGCDIPANEIAEALDSGMCSWCAHMSAKNERED